MFGWLRLMALHYTTNTVRLLCHIGCSSIVAAFGNPDVLELQRRFQKFSEGFPHSFQWEKKDDK